MLLLATRTMIMIDMRFLGGVVHCEEVGHTDAASENT